MPFSVLIGLRFFSSRFHPIFFRVCALDLQARVRCPTQNPQSEESRPEQALKEELAGMECYQATKVHPHNLFSGPATSCADQHPSAESRAA